MVEARGHFRAALSIATKILSLPLAEKRPKRPA
jgi:hypothetical protein